MKSQVKKIGYAGMLVLLVLWMGQAEGGGVDGKSLVGRLKSMYSGLLSRVRGVEQKMGGVEKQIVNVQTVSKIAKARADSAEVNANEAKKRAESAEVNANEAKKRAESAEVNANEAKKRAESAEVNANEAKARGNEAETKAKDAKDKAHSAEQRAKAAEVQARDAKARAAEAENEARAAVQRAYAAEKQAAERAKRLEQQAERAKNRAKDAEREVAEVRKKAAETAQSVAALERQLREQIRAFQAFKQKQDLFNRRIGGLGRSFWWKGVLFKARWIPAGSFVMGSPDGDNEAQGDEKPQRLVTLTKGYWMMETEVTQGQYKAVMGYNPSKHALCGDNCPVESVTWHDAALFANKLSEARQQPKCFTCKGAGKQARCDAWGNKGSDYIGCKGWRLPTEAEWEYAARAGATTSRYGAVDAVGWYKANSGGKTQPVWKKQPNAWGLYDMLGNVWEWVYDGYDNNAHKKLGAVDPVYVAAASFRVLRGGSWNYGAQSLRAASRGGYADAHSYLGFRLLRR